jgi:hypothetical protein
MENITTKYVKIIENKHDNNNNLKIVVGYDLGGYNYGTGREKPRGYYISATPVERFTRNGCNLESFAAFTGVYNLIEPCTRKSKKAEAAALEKLASYEEMMLTYFYNKYGYILEV